MLWCLNTPAREVFYTYYKYNILLYMHHAFHKMPLSNFLYTHFSAMRLIGDLKSSKKRLLRNALMKMLSFMDTNLAIKIYMQ